MDPNDSDIDYLKEADAKIFNINDMNYGDSSLLNLYHLIRDAPVSLLLCTSHLVVTKQE
jgi:hypothetical protein